ncbi:MAG: radical SAM protein [Pseudomonadota bacterium]
MGLLYIATYAKQEIKKNLLDIELRILDANFDGKNSPVQTSRGYHLGLNESELTAELLSYKPDIVGISNNFTYLVEDVLEICRITKKVLPDCLQIVGGAHATIAHMGLIEVPEIDIICRGEGELTFWEIISSNYKNIGMENIQGITYQKDGKVIENPDRPRIMDLDMLPIPDRSLIPYEKYIKSVGYEITTMNKPIGMIFSSRGCPFNCVFCSTQKVWSNVWRGRSPENIIEEIEYLISNYGVKEICFQDDQFVWDKKRILELCRLILEKKLNISFMMPPGTSPALLDENVLMMMRKAGLYRITFSVDVGTEKSKAFVKKPVKLDKIRGLIKIANSMGLLTTGSFVIGFPDETEADIEEMLEFAYNLRLDNLSLYIAQPYLGSRLYDMYLEKGLISQSIGKEFYNMTESHIGTEHISSDRLQEIRDLAVQRYFKIYCMRLFNPGYFIKEFLPKIYSKKNFLYFMRVVASFIKNTIKTKLNA